MWKQPGGSDNKDLNAYLLSGDCELTIYGLLRDKNILDIFTTF